MLLDEFLYKIGFDVDSGKIKQIEQGLKNISNIAKQTAQPISDAVKAGMERNAELIAKLDKPKIKAQSGARKRKGKPRNSLTGFHEVAEAEERQAKKQNKQSKETKKLTEKKASYQFKTRAKQYKKQIYTNRRSSNSGQWANSKLLDRAFAKHPRVSETKE